MPVRCVIGMQWGDEGKGKILDGMAADADVVVRFQGGANAGHTVVVGERRYAFHLLPSGVIHPGRRNVLASGMVIDPEQLLREIDAFRGQGVELEGRLFVSSAAHLVLPYHRALDQASEESGSGPRIGTTGRGIGPAYADKALRRGIRVGDLLSTDRLRAKLQANVEHANRQLQAIHSLPPLDLEQIYSECCAHAERLGPFVRDTFRLLHDELERGSEVLLEGAQGVLLDLDFGTYPYVTSSNSSAAGISVGSGLAPKHIGEVIGVAKAYCTRVGEGPFPTEDRGEVGERLRERGREFGTTTGRPRRCGWFDAVAARFAARQSGVDRIALTKLDTLSGLDELRVCVAYEVDGTQQPDYPVGTVDLSNVRPVYRSFPGWVEEIDGVRRVEDLPDSARRYLDGLVEEVNVPLSVISVGPARDQAIPCSSS